MDNLQAVRGALNQFLNNPTWDILLLLFFFFAVFVYGLVVGRNKITVLLLASYPAVLMNEYFPYPRQFLRNLNALQMLFLKSFGFLVLTLFVFWVLGNAGFSRKEINKKTGQVIFLSFLNVGFWSNVIFGYALKINEETVKLVPLTRLLFGSDVSHFAWLAMPVLILCWLARR